MKIYSALTGKLLIDTVLEPPNCLMNFDFKDADLEGADLSWLDLSGADFLEFTSS